MERFQFKPNLVPQAAAAAPAMSDDVWLDDVVGTLGSGNMVPWQAEHIRLRLRGISFGAILAAIERARPDIAAATEIALYTQWIDANNGTSPHLYVAWFNLGALFAQSGNPGNAAVAYGNALVFRPDMHAAAINLGLLHEAAGQTEQALAVWQRAVQPDETRVALQIQQGRLLESMGRLQEAEQILHRVLLTDPAQPDVIHHLVHIRQKMCQWPAAASTIPGLSAQALIEGSGPLGALALTDDIRVQSASAARWVSRKTAPAPRRLAPVKPYPRQRIRIGYMSSDFCSHAMSYLVTELFERHDRRLFEVYGYCCSVDDGSDIRKRVLAAFDHYRIIRTLSDEQAAQVIRDDEIDVLVDLNGLTEGTRLAVLRWRPAPVQATYLGFIGPLPMPELDYLLCDRIVIPPEHEAAYRPTPLPIAGVYQANDSKRTTGRKLSRTEAGLPRDAFVYCSFSKHFKITEAMFGAWMAILRQTPHAVLWLAEDNAYSKANMLAAACGAGIQEHRLVFSERADPDLYLSRLGLADLFLDTFPYNTGTVASDAIRMCLPLVTLCGEAFASRMATSLLYAAGAPMGITTSLANYVDVAVTLGNDPAAYGRYKALFNEQTWGRTIGDIAGFTANYETMWCRIVGDLRAIHA